MARRKKKNNENENKYTHTLFFLDICYYTKNNNYRKLYKLIN